MAAEEKTVILEESDVVTEDNLKCEVEKFE